MAVVSFDKNEFLGIYPEFADTEEARLFFAFNSACLLANNSENSQIPYNPPAECARKTVLYMLTAHLCALAQRGGQVVGVVASASEGSVSASFVTPASPDAHWFNQTQYGASAWRMLLGFCLGGALFNGSFR